MRAPGLRCRRDLEGTHLRASLTLRRGASLRVQPCCDRPEAPRELPPGPGRGGGAALTGSRPRALRPLPLRTCPLLSRGGGTAGPRVRGGKRSGARRALPPPRSVPAGGARRGRCCVGGCWAGGSCLRGQALRRLPGRFGCSFGRG